MEIEIGQIQKLRSTTGLGMMDCKNALIEATGDFDKAIEILRIKGEKIADKKSQRTTSEGIIGSYIHSNRIGVLIEVNCESPFVTKSDEFQEFVKNLAMHIAAASPLYVSKKDIPNDIITKERNIHKESLINEGKPKHILDKIIDGKMKKYINSICLLEQEYIKDTDKTIQEYLMEIIGTLRENIVIKRFIRFQVGETD